MTASSQVEHVEPSLFDQVTTDRWCIHCIAAMKQQLRENGGPLGKTVTLCLPELCEAPLHDEVMSVQVVEAERWVLTRHHPRRISKYRRRGGDQQK